MPALDIALEDAQKLLKNAKKLVVLTGAGVSKESGIPTFRDALTGMWENYDPEDLATPEGFKKNPPLVWQWYDDRRKQLVNIKPNPGHFAICELEKHFEALPVITQNIDGLHFAAGSSDVVELHGSITSFKCFDNGHPVEEEIEFGLKEPPLCKNCQSVVRPSVVWFGEALPEEAIARAFKECEGACVLLVVGTSGMVHPAASLPYTGQRSGARLIEVNPESTPLTDSCDVFLKGPSGVVLPKLLDLIAG